jgi:hypothetical protein
MGVLLEVAVVRRLRALSFLLLIKVQLVLASTSSREGKNANQPKKNFYC